MTPFQTIPRCKVPCERECARKAPGSITHDRWVNPRYNDGVCTLFETADPEFLTDTPDGGPPAQGYDLEKYAAAPMGDF